MATALGAFLERLARAGLEAFRRYYGDYRAIVTRNDDPEERGRIQAVCPAVGQDQALDLWIDPAFAGAGDDRGNFWPPEVGDAVRVCFECGDPSKPDVYYGGWFGYDPRDLPVEFQYSNSVPQRRGMVTRMGHLLVFNDEPGNERVRLLWHKPDPGDPALTDPKESADRTQGEYSFLSFNEDGSIQLVNKEGSNINMNATDGNITIMDQNGNTITLNSSGVQMVDKAGNYVLLANGECSVTASKNIHLTGPTVNIKGGTVAIGDGASKSLVFGEDLLTWLNKHQHPTGTGPSGPPIEPALPAMLSQSVKTR